ncbi:LysM peptidoglycan-binding domain-containing protein [Lichenifustis flavocetrariae]|uniref:LysM peptidoglycan-binding domain-containing protein n=1 Tax=Lichenifustis flavocetrariae TaxID=2949735 RepID=A0AA41Z6B4_9HYPH|nr:LysM peptidoglycan-binding domain-containing protein [Lichenifustis flavocetrariae]MCW6511140.1 LysM peptidoglycan-binding domain-containing protein [Lichenifustis flavocetrariae]
MLSFVSDRRFLAASAAFITAGILFFLIWTYPSWQDAIGKHFSSQAGSAPMEPAVAVAPAKKPLEGPASIAPVDKASAVRPADAATTASKEDAAGEQPKSDELKPSFDVVRVEPSGESVIAARAAAGVTIVLLDGGRPIARAQADASGQVAFVPPTLAPGEHNLMLSVGEPNTPGALSSESVAVSVPDQAKTPPMVALISPDQPTKVLSGTDSSQAAPGASTSGGAASTPAVSVSAIDVEDLGSIYASGRAAPGSHCRIYLNGSFVAVVTTGQDGLWSLKIKRGMKPGRYVVRVDQVASTAGQVQARAEVPFDYPSRLGTSSSLLRPKSRDAATGRASAVIDTAAVAPASVSPASQPAVPQGRLASNVSQNAGAQNGLTAAPGPSPSGTVVAQLVTAKVMHGDSLWRISRKILGHGQRYTQIYAANTLQIRDPRLIYPGQIFVLPQSTQ